MLFAELKDKNSSHEDNEGKSTFLAITIELYKQKKKNKKITLKISNKLYQGSCGFKWTRTIFCCLASVFLKNLKHLLHPILVLLF